MFSPKHFIDDIADIPGSWIFENYLALSETLDGQSMRIRSVFNPDDTTPSMFLYLNKDHQDYRFKCFSTGKGGSAVDLMMFVWKKNFRDSMLQIQEDYKNFLRSGNKPKQIMDFAFARWRVQNFENRTWTKDDQRFWSPFNIGSKLLEQYEVVPLSEYLMRKDPVEGYPLQEFTITGRHLYGYYTQSGVLYKIYQPYNKDRKFIKVFDYIQGSDQLEGHNTLIIASSLKDIMTLKSLNIKADMIAPDSENTGIDEKLLDEYRQEYQSIITMFDNDDAGIRSMKHYEEKLRIPFCYLPLEKDVSDAVKKHGTKKVLYDLIPVIDRAVSKYKALKNPIDPLSYVVL